MACLKQQATVMISKGPHLTDRPTEWRTSLTNELLNISPSCPCRLLLQLRVVIYLYYLFIYFHLSFSSPSFILFHLFLLQTALCSLPTSDVWHMFSMAMSQRHHLRVSPLCQWLWGAEVGLGEASARQHDICWGQTDCRGEDILLTRRECLWFIHGDGFVTLAPHSTSLKNEPVVRAGVARQPAGPEGFGVRRLRRTSYFITHFKYYFFQCEGRDS